MRESLGSDGHGHVSCSLSPHLAASTPRVCEDERVNDSNVPERVEAVVVGAGLAGLAAATTLHESGREVLILEKSDGVGGRVRTDEIDGFRLDRGFQVLLTAYPEVHRQFDLSALDLQPFAPGALVWLGERGYRVGDPFREPSTLLDTVRSPIGSPVDKLRLLGLRTRLKRADPRELLRGPDIPTGRYLRDLGFSARFVDRFLGPLFAGIQLDPALGTSRRMFDTIFRSLTIGESAVPAAGMGAIPQQLASRLPAGAVQLNTEVAAVAPGEVRVAGGARVEADMVIVATEGPVAARLVDIAPVGSRSVSCAYFSAPSDPIGEPVVVLDGGHTGPVANLAVMSTLTPTYAPAGRTLIAAACPGRQPVDFEAMVRAQLAGWFGAQVESWEHLRTYHIDHGQPDQSPPFHPKEKVRLADRLWVCGDHRDTGSIQGALFSGRRTGEAVAAALT